WGSQVAAPRNFTNSPAIEAFKSRVFRPDDFPPISMDRLCHLIAECDGRLDEYGWRSRSRTPGEDVHTPMTASTPTLEAVNTAITYFNDFPEECLAKSITSYSLSQLVKKVQYTGNAAVILALIAVGRGQHWLYHVSETRNLMASPVTLWHGGHQEAII
ncbi:hypothetical protein BDZ88DRAFT_441527, partial [Geranomyces variabilis]